MKSDGPRSLAGIRVLDLSRILAGPYCTMILGDLGAEIIKVEQTDRGDDLRRWGPPFTADGESTYFLSVNRNKRGVTANLKTPEGVDLTRELAARSDVVVENFRTGTLEALGLGYEELRSRNPRLVYCSITGYGSTGPLAGAPGFDLVIQGMGGLMSVTGEPEGRPLKVAVAIVDIVTGLYAAIGILAALKSREQSGLGQKVEVSLLDAELSALVNVAGDWLLAGRTPARLGNAHPNVAPYEVFATRDGHITIAVGNDAQWGSLCRAVGRPDLATDDRFANNAARLAHRRALTSLLEGVFSARSSGEWLALLERHEVPSGPIYTVPEILAHPQVTERGVVTTLEHPTAGVLRLIRSPLRMSHDSTEPMLSPPRLGADTEAILREVLGYDDEKITQLRKEGAL